jgi:hypothetical protein
MSKMDILWVKAQKAQPWISPRGVEPADQNISQRQRRITTKETGRKKAQKLADEYKRAAGTKRNLKQTRAVLDRLHEELSGENVVRTSFHQY